MLGWLLVLGISLAAEPPVEETPFVAVDAAMSAGKRNDAGDLLLAMVADPAAVVSHGEAWRRLATLFTGVDLDVAALAAWHEALKADPAGTGSALVTILAVAAEMGDEERLAPGAVNWLAYSPDVNTRSKLGLLAARDNLRHDNLGAAVGLIPLVDKGSPSFADAEVVKGVANSLQGAHGAAVTAFQQALVAGKDREPKWRDTTSLNLARAMFAEGNWALAMVHYAKVPRSSHLWPEAQYERAWSHFRADDMTGTLALLMTHDTPFFDHWYMPEVDLLRAYSYFLLCKFPDASREIDAFVITWTPVRDGIASTLSTMTPAQAFADVRDHLAGKKTSLPPNVLRHFKYDDRLADAAILVDRANVDLGRIDSLGGSALGTKARELITMRRDAVIDEQGQRVIARALRANTELSDMLGGIEITRLDLLNLEAQIYERAAATGALEFGDPIGKLRKLTKEKRGFRVWPYEGESWMDELGWYRIDTRPDCPEGMSRGEATR